MKELFLLGSTGSIGETTLNVIKKEKQNFKVTLLSTNNNVNKIYKQALKFNVKIIVIHNKEKYFKSVEKFRKKKIKVFPTVKEALKNKKNKSYLTINAISGINGLNPSLNIIKKTKNFAMANKESIICGWSFIKRELKKSNTNFIPLDSEHFSIWSLIKSEKIKNIKKIYLTASGGPFLKRELKDIKNIKPKFALNHPNWKMGDKISIDSATMMNKIFEIIEAIKIFELDRNKFEILIHPKSYIHAIVHFNSGLIKFLAHDTTMKIPIANALNFNKEKKLFQNLHFNYEKLNGINFIKPDLRKFPLLKILNYKFKNTYFEIILVAINDNLVKRYLNMNISYIELHKKILILLKKPYFVKYFNTKPKNINEIKIMVGKVEDYLNKYFNKNDNFI